MSRSSIEEAKFWFEYALGACFFGGFVGLIVSALGAPEGAGVMAGITAGVVALAYIVSTRVRNEDGPRT